MAVDLVDELVASRLAKAGDPAGLREATVALAAGELRSPTTDRLMGDQMRQLRSPGSSALPDAYLAIEAITEDALQWAAAGLRAARAAAGDLLDAPGARAFERGLAQVLSDDPRLAIRAETARVPRPTTRPATLGWSLTPVPWAAAHREDDSWPPHGLSATTELTRLPAGVDDLARVVGGPYDGWVQIGLVERQRTPQCSHPPRPLRAIMIMIGLELDGQERPTKTLPFGAAPWRLWTTGPEELAEELDRSYALENLHSAGGRPLLALGDTRREITSLGEPPHLLVPTPLLIDALELQPSASLYGLRLDDSAGAALVARTWRGHPVHDGSLQPTVPAVVGGEVLLREDLFERVCDEAGEGRLGAGVSISSRSGDD